MPVLQMRCVCFRMMLILPMGWLRTVQCGVIITILEGREEVATKLILQNKVDHFSRLG